MKNFFERFVVKTIVAKNGEEHFKRWAIIETRYGSLYIHKISKSDEDKDPHDHPWNFWSFVISGGYIEALNNDGLTFQGVFPRFSLIKRSSKDFHKIKLLDIDNPTWTIVWVGKKTHPLWGYSTANGWIDHISYRMKKNNGVV